MSNKTCIFSFFDPNTQKLLKKQWKFYDTALKAAAGESPKKFIYFGGGVNCGKSYTAMFTLAKLCSLYPGSKYYVIRESLPSLITTTVETAKKLLIASKGRWIRDKSNYRYIFPNGSAIHFFSENYDADKELFRFRGLEYNGVLLEEANELQPETYYKAIERNGRWKPPNGIVPQPILLATFNPSPNEFWRNLFYYPVKHNAIPENTEIILANVADNPFCTDAEREMYQMLDKAHYDTFINGNWEAFQNIKAWAYAFDKNKHVGDVKRNENEGVVISFDFNVNPIVCIMAHVNQVKKYIRVFKEFKIKDSNIYQLCEEIRPHLNYRYPITITGDATGRNRNVAIKEGGTVYSIIIERLGLLPAALNGVPMKNLSLIDSRVVVNGVLENFDVKIDYSCKNLINDLLAVEATEDGKIEKTKNKELSHLLDTFRYICNKYFTHFFLKQ